MWGSSPLSLSLSLSLAPSLSLVESLSLRVVLHGPRKWDGPARIPAVRIMPHVSLGRRRLSFSMLGWHGEARF